MSEILDLEVEKKDIPGGSEEPDEWTPMKSLSEFNDKISEDWNPIQNLSELTSSEINEKDLSEFINVWDIIDTYFRDTLYYKSQHQVDSYNEFMFSEKNGIKNIIRGENPFIIKKGENAQGSFDYEIKIYFGESIDEHGNIISGVDNFFISSPNIEDENGNFKYLYPNDARLRGLTYSSNIYCNVGIIYHYNNGIRPDVVKNIQKLNIGTIPIMLHSKLCILYQLDSIKLSEFGECPYDQGGYFIINGNEKVMISQDTKINNILYINKNSDEKIILKGTIKSISTSGFQSSRTNNILYRIKSIQQNVNGENIYKKYNIFEVRILDIGDKNFNIPLFILFRALGIESDREILSMIIYDNDDDLLKNKIYDIILPSIKDSEPIYTQKDAIKYLSLNVEYNEVFNVFDKLNHNFLPSYVSSDDDDNNLLNNYLEKAKYLAYCIRKIILTDLKILKETDRDSYINKRVELPGALLLELYREFWERYKKRILKNIETEYKIHYNNKGNDDIFNIINNSNRSKIFEKNIMDELLRSFGSKFGGVTKRDGIVQPLNRVQNLGTLSHIRRINTSIPSGVKVAGPRKLHNSQWGIVCPTESPDGGNVGLHNHLAFIARVTTNIDENEIYLSLIDDHLKPRFFPSPQIVSTDLYDSTKVFLNGRFIGIHHDPYHLMKYMKLLKLNSIINITTSLSFNKDTNEFHFFCDSGRIIRPVFCLRNKKGKKFNSLIFKDYTKLRNWKTCIHGILSDNELINYNTSRYFKEILDQIVSEHGDKFMDHLEEHSSPIEYIDSLETENSFISKSMDDIQNHDFSHCEIHSSLILGAVALNIPFPEHSQYPRNVFSCQQTKGHAVGIYSTAYNTRFETNVNILNYPQRPIVTTRYKKYTDVDKLPYGINAIVAIASYTGYNQEDALILNQCSIDRGLFKSFYLRSYTEEEEYSFGKKIYFANPLLEKNVHKIDSNKHKYKYLDENGFIKENTHITDKDIFVAKCHKKTLPNGEEITKVKGSKITTWSSGIIDKVIVTKDKNNLRKCKIRVRKEKIPTIGDKFASRCGQKGMVGLVIPSWEMPFTKDGLVPDVIINPHAIPSRMTINQLLEVILGKTACMSGHLGDATPFQNNDINEFGDALESFNYERNGNEVMYSGITGDQIKTSIFIGPTYYQRLKIMVADKMFYRTTGGYQTLNRQPVGGRVNEGGMRIGEMERDSILSHGASHFLNETMMDRSDAYEVDIDKKTGFISDGGTDNDRIKLPYAAKLFIQELQSMVLSIRFITEQEIYNKPVFNYLKDKIQGNQREEIDISHHFKEIQEESYIEQSRPSKDIHDLTDIDVFQKRKDVFENTDEDKENCEKEISWKQLNNIKNTKDYENLLNEIKTNPKYIHFNQTYFHAGDIQQFERYGYLHSKSLNYPKKYIDDKSIFSGNNYESTYNTFKYMFDKLKKGVYIIIKDNELTTYLPFSNVNYRNNWSHILKESNPKLLTKIIKEERNIHNDPSHWYANNCFFTYNTLKFKFNDFIEEGDKTIVQFKHFLIDFLEYCKQNGKKFDDIEFFFSPRDFPILREGFKEPYNHLFDDKKIEKDYQFKTFTPILSQCSASGYENKENTDPKLDLKFHDIMVPTQDDMMRISDKIHPDDCKNNYAHTTDFELDWDKKKKTCVFRGGMTGCGMTKETNMRLKAAKMSYDFEKTGKNMREGSKIVDMKLTSLNWFSRYKIYQKEFNSSEETFEKLPSDFKKDIEKDPKTKRSKNFMSLQEQSKCKYILNIDGHVKAFRLGNELRMGSVILLVDSPYRVWFQEKLKDNEHYILVKHDLSDLIKKIQWCHKNDEKCKQIAKNALQFYNDNLSKEGTFTYFENIMRGLSKIRKQPVIQKNKYNVNLVVAYRDPGDGSRKTHLDIFVQQMISILSEKTNLAIYIIEQESTRDDYDSLPENIKQNESNFAKFNLGRLKNIGFKISSDEKHVNDDNTYYILSDVDLLPSFPLTDDYLKFPKNIIHLGNKGTRYEQSEGERKNFLGGVFSINKKDFEKCNGYPNNFWGWGGEDDVLRNRIHLNKLIIDNPTQPVIDLEEHKIIKEKTDELWDQNMLMKKEIKKAKTKLDKTSWKENGLSNIEDSYEIISESNYNDLENVQHIMVKLKIQDFDKK